MNVSLPINYRVLRGLVHILTRAFFEEIAVEGRDLIPEKTGGLVVAWHPNGLVDPALMLANFPGRIVFGARHGLFRWPLLGSILRGLGTIPIYRESDASAKSRKQRLEANEASLEALARQLAEGSYAALFPEGLSHDHPHLVEVKNGAARLYYRAVELAHPDRPPPVIIPVGLHYDRKNIFRSRVLVCFHTPLDLPPELLVRPGEKIEPTKLRQMQRALTDVMERSLVEVARATENWELHHLMHRLRKMVRAERASRAGANPGRPSIAERELGFARVWYAYNQRRSTHEREVESLRQDVASYDQDLRSLGLEDHDLALNPRLASPLWIGIMALQLVTVFLLLPPLLLAGYVINAIPYYALRLLSRRFSKEEKDAATLKILGGSILFPCAWGGAAFLATRAHHELHLMFPSLPDAPVTIAAVTVALGVLGGLVALIYNELSADTLRALRVRISRVRHRDAIASLARRRAAIFKQVTELMQGLSLPGDVADDGRVLSPSDDK